MSKESSQMERPDDVSHMTLRPRRSALQDISNQRISAVNGNDKSTSKGKRKTVETVSLCVCGSIYSMTFCAVLAGGGHYISELPY